ncbi:MAG: energy-coupling factor ABC transporter ATP-binding protein, partial [Candidatus Helarchaeota archaeon]|nr:energy-coupling factor ABC transporter ATP-binding protein [Candidatus Helarchaeota archaeon]
CALRKPHHLSMGEKKRAAIATVLVLEPEVIIFDEPTLALDPAGRKNLIRFIKSLKSTKIIATHDIGMALEICKRVVLMENGRIIVDGEINKILGNQKLMNEIGMEVPTSLKIHKKHTNEPKQ